MTNILVLCVFMFLCIIVNLYLTARLFTKLKDLIDIEDSFKNVAKEFLRIDKEFTKNIQNITEKLFEDVVKDHECNKDIMEKLMDCVEKDHYNNITLINHIRTDIEERDRINDDRWNMIHDAIVNETFNGTTNKIGEDHTWTSFNGYTKIVELKDKVLIMHNGSIWGYADSVDDAYRILEEDGLLEAGVIIIKA